MLALALEITVVVAWFLWAYRRQVRAHREANRPPPQQLRLSLGKERPEAAMRPTPARSSDASHSASSRRPAHREERELGS
jgi:hypothetical protein